jgi:hypothetical protein
VNSALCCCDGRRHGTNELLLGVLGQHVGERLAKLLDEINHAWSPARRDIIIKFDNVAIFDGGNSRPTSTGADNVSSLLAALRSLRAPVGLWLLAAQLLQGFPRIANFG